jgi:hypothetical protein
MSITVHHQPLDPALSWTLRAWQLAWDGNSVWDVDGVKSGKLLEFQFPDVADPRKVNFKYRSTSSGQTTWEPDDFVRQIVPDSGLSALPGRRRRLPSPARHGG